MEVFLALAGARVADHPGIPQHPLSSLLPESQVLAMAAHYLGIPLFSMWVVVWGVLKTALQKNVPESFGVWVVVWVVLGMIAPSEGIHRLATVAIWGAGGAFLWVVPWFALAPPVTIWLVGWGDWVAPWLLLWAVGGGLIWGKEDGKKLIRLIGKVYKQTKSKRAKRKGRLKAMAARAFMVLFVGLFVASTVVTAIQAALNESLTVGFVVGLGIVFGTLILSSAFMWLIAMFGFLWAMAIIFVLLLTSGGPFGAAEAAITIVWLIVCTTVVKRLGLFGRRAALKPLWRWRPEGMFRLIGLFRRRAALRPLRRMLGLFGRAGLKPWRPVQRHIGRG